MNGRERIFKILNHEKTDRIGLYEQFWGGTYEAWQEQGHIKRGESFTTHFDFDIELCGGLNLMADLDFKPEIISETDETVTCLDGNGAVMRRFKDGHGTPEHVDFTVKEREQWETNIKPKLTVDRRRIDFDGYRSMREKAAREGRFFALCGLNVFECIHPVCGHENMLAGMLLDPEWIKDMADTYAELIVSLQEMLFEQEGYPDGIWYFEDMGYKGSPFMSPKLYRELIQPAHKTTIRFAKERNMPVIMHSCGFVEPLLPDMIDAGIDCLQAMEVKAGMDLLRIQENFGKQIALIGGIDVRALYSNDKSVIDAELESKIPLVKQGFNYVLHSDHSIPPTVDYESYRYFIERGLQLGTFE